MSCAVSPAPSDLMLMVVIVTDSSAVVQVAGAALIGVSQSRQASGEVSKVTPKQANDILLAGLACQVSGEA
jgi:hypothetical protein